MLDLVLSFIENELDHDARDHGHGNGDHDHKVVGIARLLLVHLHLVDREGVSGHVVDQIFVTRRCLQERLVHEVRHHGS